MKENKVIYQHVFESVSLDGGKSHGIPSIGVFEFKDGKIEQHRLLCNRLLVAKQAAKGWFARKMEGTIVNRWKKELHSS